MLIWQTDFEMQLILVKYGQEDFNIIDVPDDSDGNLLAQMVVAELALSLDQLQLEFEGIPIEHHTLAALGVVDGSTITVKTAGKKPRMSIYDIPRDIKPEELIELTLTNPQILQQYSAEDPDLGNVLATKDVAKVRMFLMKRHMQQHKVVYTRKEEIKAFEADPDNPELQKKMEERVIPLTHACHCVVTSHFVDRFVWRTSKRTWRQRWRICRSPSAVSSCSTSTLKSMGTPSRRSSTAVHRAPS